MIKIKQIKRFASQLTRPDYVYLLAHLYDQALAGRDSSLSVIEQDELTAWLECQQNVPDPVVFAATQLICQYLSDDILAKIAADPDYIIDVMRDIVDKEAARLSLRPLKQREIAQELGCSVSHVARLQAGGIIPKGATMQDVQGYLVGLTKRDPINNTVEQVLEKYKKGS